MTTINTSNGGTTFRIKRSPITMSGFNSDVDPTVKSHLDELNEILGRRVFSRTPTRAALIKEEETAEAEREDEPIGEGFGEAFKEGLANLSGGLLGSTRKRGALSSHTRSRTRVEPDVTDTLSLPLTPKRIPEKTWFPDSLLDWFSNAPEEAENITLSDYIDMTASLSSLKDAFQSSLMASWLSLDYNTKAVLQHYPAISDYLLTYAFHNMDLTEVSGVKNFILNNSAGVRNIINYVSISAARSIIDKEQLNVPHYNDDDGDLVGAIKAANKAKKLVLSSVSFNSAVQKIIDNFVFNSREAQIIKKAEAVVGKIPEEYKPLLIQYIKSSPIYIDDNNAPLFLPLFISQIRGTVEISQPTETDPEEADKDFRVDRLEDDQALIQVSKSAVRCAAQLYYVMTLGDELAVFDTVNYFTHKYLIRGGIEIQNSQLREDLQNYVFSNRFFDLRNKKLRDRTRPAERQMFYRQVFSYGNLQTTDDLIPNTEFPKLWKVLMLESARYLERAQASPNPDSYVSRQNVMQAVEDLQYNLSTHCTGMANVITPLIYAELDFVIRRIFMHPEVMRQVVPAGSTWWRVVEALYMGMRNVRPKATVFYNKAKLGNDIIRSIADYNPATFEDDTSFSAFISNVDAFITTQSILQESLSDDLRRGEDEGDAAQNGSSKGYQNGNGAASSNGSNNGHDEWDF